ncbi:MAG TPA: hypothetical protein VJY62_06550 [Bacteroidia bacterium]|nr:hypothetical protein [Bacteroidia bacterium]
MKSSIAFTGCSIVFLILIIICSSNHFTHKEPVHDCKRDAVNTALQDSVEFEGHPHIEIENKEKELQTILDEAKTSGLTQKHIKEFRDIISNINITKEITANEIDLIAQLSRISNTSKETATYLAENFIEMFKIFIEVKNPPVEEAKSLFNRIPNDYLFMPSPPSSEKKVFYDAEKIQVNVCVLYNIMHPKYTRSEQLYICSANEGFKEILSEKMSTVEWMGNKKFAIYGEVLKAEKMGLRKNIEIIVKK